MFGTADDGTFQFYNRNSAANLVYLTNDLTSLQTYKGLEISMTKRMSNRWQMLAGYTYSQTAHRGRERKRQPERALNAAGPLTGQLGDRPHQFKLTGTYITPFYDIGVAGNLNAQSGILLTRQLNTALTVGGNTTVNVEPLGSYRLDQRTSIDLRAFKTRAIRRRARARGVGGLQQPDEQQRRVGRPHAGRHHQPAPERRSSRRHQHACRNSARPSQILGPRNIRFNVAFRF